MSPRLGELLCDRALTGLDEDAAAELEQLLEEADVDPDVGLEIAAAHVELALSGHEPSKMPADLAARIIDQFDCVGEDRARPRPEARVIAVELPSVEEAPVRRRPRPWWGSLHFAAAACVAFVLGSFVGQGFGPEVALRAERLELPRVDLPAPSLAKQRAELIATADDVMRIEWKASDDAASRGSSGDVVWSPKRQKGFMRFSGLRQNDETRMRYQLWIFDKQRDDRYPVDGGLFDIDQKTGDIIVPIEANLKVLEPSLFAVTAEPPTGVMVSDRKRIVLTASVDG